jgi:threonine dehydratase
VRAARPPAPDELRAAEAVVARHLAPTPLLAAGDGIHLKAETLQPTGAFKVRGALAALHASEGAVVTASAGNHALGVGHAAALLGREATVVVARTASPAKVERIRELPVELVEAGDDYDAAEAHALALASERGVPYLSPYNDPHVIAGQRTVAVEIGAQLDGPFTLVCPVGGGGLLAGCALWAAERGDVRVVGVEVERSRAISAAVAAGRVVPVEVGDTLADGMAGGLEPGSVTVDIVREHVDAIVAVSEQALRDGLRALAFEHGLIAEGAGAAAFAALRAGHVTDRPAVAIVSGRNITRGQLLDVLRG